MKTLRAILVVTIVGCLPSAQAMAQQTASSSLAQPLLRPAALAPDGYTAYTAAQADTGAAPPAPGSAPAAKPAEPKAEEKQAEEKKEEKKEGEEEKKEEEEKPWKLFDGPWLECHRIDMRGWLDQSFTWNPNNPADRFNGPVGYNDRSNEYELNQLYLITERVTKTDECHPIDVGGRLDLLYGTDWRYARATGLDTEWGNRFYGLALPNMYADVAINNLVLRGGHFLAPCGYESVMAPENFFLSHSYSFLYGQPTTLSGAMGIYKLNDQWSFNAGIDTGWNDWVAPNDKISYLFGCNWTSKDQKRTLAFEMFIGDQIDVPSTRTHYCLVFTQKLGEKWQYALENNVGYETNSHLLPNGNRTHGDWVGVSNYLFRTLNDQWSLGFRCEWFGDDDGTVVGRVGPPAVTPVPGDYLDLAVGLNYKPNKNVVWRTEWRYDHSTADVFEHGTTPDKDQFLWSIDAIVRF
jgi:hypothetical protein